MSSRWSASPSSRSPEEETNNDRMLHTCSSRLANSKMPNRALQLVSANQPSHQQFCPDRSFLLLSC